MGTDPGSKSGSYFLILLSYVGAALVVPLQTSVVRYKLVAGLNEVRDREFLFLFLEWVRISKGTGPRIRIRNFEQTVNKILSVRTDPIQ